MLFSADRVWETVEFPEREGGKKEVYSLGKDKGVVRINLGMAKGDNSMDLDSSSRR